MTCKELHDRILEEFLEPDTGILNILPEKQVRALLDTPEEPAPEWLLQVCRENAVTDDFEEHDEFTPVAAEPEQTPMKQVHRLSLTEMLRWAAAEAERRNRGNDRRV